MDAIRPSKLKPCDVLLYHGTGWISDLIREFDGGPYSHAAIWNGKHVLEAVADGVKKRTLKTSVRGAKYVDVYRWLSGDGEDLGSPDYPPEPIVHRIEHYREEGDRYAYEALLLLALLTTTRRVSADISPQLARILRPLLDEAFSILTDLMADGKEPMICSELVYRCYTEADAGKYPIGIPGLTALALATEEGVMTPMSAALAAQPTIAAPEIIALQRDAEELLQMYLMAKRVDVEALRAEAAMAPAVAVKPVADFVTPRDLKGSRNLKNVGRLKI